jgi:hypothetical protein
LLNSFAIISKKRITKIEIYTTSLFALTLSAIADVFLDLKYELYHYFKEDVEYVDLVAIFGIYPAINILFLNYFPFQKTLRIKIIYILGWTIFAICYEWVAVHTEFFNYSGWKLLYSIPIYPLLYIILFYNLKFVRWLLFNRG